MNMFEPTLNAIDAMLKEFGVKYVFVESGDLAIKEKCEEQGLDVNDYPGCLYWCELSWGAGEDDKYDFAYNAFGKTLGEAMDSCLEGFRAAVIFQKEEQVAAAKEFGVYEKLLRS